MKITERERERKNVRKSYRLEGSLMRVEAMKELNSLDHLRGSANVGGGRTGIPIIAFRDTQHTTHTTHTRHVRPSVTPD
jgi:allophanate hydrolase subunit 2